MVLTAPYHKLCMVTEVIKNPSDEQRNFIINYWKNKSDNIIFDILDFELIKIVFINSIKEYTYPNTSSIFSKLKYNFYYRRKFLKQLNTYASEEIKDLVKNLKKKKENK